MRRTKVKAYFPVRVTVEEQPLILLLQKFKHTLKMLDKIYTAHANVLEFDWSSSHQLSK